MLLDASSPRGVFSPFFLSVLPVGLAGGGPLTSPHTVRTCGHQLSIYLKPVEKWMHKAALIQGLSLNEEQSKQFSSGCISDWMGG